GRSALEQVKRAHTETSPVLTGGDVDADWEEAYAVGDEAPGGDNPTPDQDRVDDIGRALGIQYADNEELKAGDKIAQRDKHRWELDPASAEDYPDHDADGRTRSTSGSRRSMTSSIEIPVVSITIASGATASGEAARVESDLSRSASAVATSASCALFELACAGSAARRRARSSGDASR